MYLFFNTVDIIANCFSYLQEGKCSNNRGHGRENFNKVDLNRDFPSQWTDLNATDSGKLIEGRQPETVAAMTWITSNPFVLSGNLHGGSVVASYPFDDSKLVAMYILIFYLNLQVNVYILIYYLYVRNGTMKFFQ